MSNAIEVPTVPPLDPSRFIEVDLYSQEIKADPSPWFLQWADKPPFYVTVHGRPHGVVCRHEWVKWALSNQEHISSVPRPGWGTDYLDFFNGLPIVLDLDPPEHTRLRRLMQPAFTPRRVSQLHEGINALVDEMMESVASQGEFDMVTEFAQPLVARLLLGTFFQFPPEDWPTFINFSHALELVATVPLGAPKPQAYMDAYTAVYNYCEAVIERHRREPQDDLVGSVIAAESGGEITTEELFATLIVLFAGGLGTVSGTLGLCMLRLCRHPDQLKLLQDDPALLQPAIEECLRIDSLGNFRHRYVVKDCVIDGLPLYRGMIVHLSIGAANYDPEFYPDPNKFDIKRNPRDISTFGHSMHFCVGQTLARTVLRIGVGKLVQRFPKIRLADPNAKIIYGGMPTERMPLNIKLRTD